MFALNLRQKMIGCFCLHLLFYIIVGSTFLKDFDMFHEDVTLLMHAGNLSNISLEIRRYEKNFIIRHDNDDFIKVLGYIDEAQQFVPQVIDDLKTMPQPSHLQDLTAKLTAYEEHFKDFKETCTSAKDAIVCPLREEVRALGQDLVTITEDLVLFEQNKMTAFIEKFTSRVVNAIFFLVMLSIFTITLLYTSIIKPLKMVENAAIDVANGSFSLLPVDEKKGEVRSVLRAFNKMVTDLEEQQEQLFQAKKLSSIGTLASGTAHQINNPLNNISTSCQLALADFGDDKDSFVVKMLETINQETQRAGEIVRGLLEFSRAQTFSPQTCQLAEIVRKVKRLVASEVPTGITIDTDIPDDVLLYVDVQKMIEALLNLTINAIQAIIEPPGSVFIGVEKDAAKKNAVITVADTGAGINQENLPKVFDPFFTTKNVENGTGLGLAVVYGIIKKQSGSIRVESTKGKGTSFIITLPLQSEPVETGLFSKNSISRKNNV
jgi:two-component system, NtrC family, sensor kinase